MGEPRPTPPSRQNKRNANFFTWLAHAFGANLKRNMEDPRKIAAKIDELNREEVVKIKPSSAGRSLTISDLEPTLYSLGIGAVPQVWQAAPGYFAFTKFEFNSGGVAPVFTPSNGIPVKAFINSKTGEIRTFLANLFET